MNIQGCYHDDRYCVEVQIPSLVRNNTVSWVRIVNGVDKYVTESMLNQKEDTASGKPIAEARPTQKPTVALTSVSIPVLDRDPHADRFAPGGAVEYAVCPVSR